MTNDNTPPDSIEGKFLLGLNELIALCMEGGLHPWRIIALMEHELKVLREDTARVDRT